MLCLGKSPVNVFLVCWIKAPFSSLLSPAAQITLGSASLLLVDRLHKPGEFTGNQIPQDPGNTCWEKLQGGLRARAREAKFPLWKQIFWYILVWPQHHHVAVRYKLLVSPPCALLFGSPGSPLNFVWQGWEKTQQLPLLFYTLFPPLPHILLRTHYFPILPTFPTKESLSSLPVRGSARHT